MHASGRRLSPPMVIAGVALFLALAGSGIASMEQFAKGTVGTPQLKRNAVTGSKLAPNAVRTGHVANGSLLVDDFKAGQIPQGPKGDKGERGDPGTAGTPGLSGLEIVQTQSTFASPSFSNITAACPSGKKVVGGGGWTEPLVTAVVLSSSRPFGDATWQAVAHEASPTSSNWRLITYAVCARTSG